MRIQEFKEGDTIPVGSKLIHTRQVRGTWLRQDVISRGFIWEKYRDVYESVTVYVYEVPDSIYEHADRGVG